MTAKTLEQMKERLRAQEAWGKWNTAPLANRIYELEQAQKPAWRRRAERWATSMFVAALSILCWVALTAPLWRMLL